MSVSKKKNSPYWHVRFRIGGVRVQESSRCTSRAEAEQYEEKRRREVREQLILGKKPSYSWSHAVERWITEMQHKRTINNDICQFRWVQPYLQDFTLGQITKDIIEDIANRKLMTGVSIATVNRLLALIRSVLYKACKEWEWINKTPHIRLRQEHNERDRWLTPQEAERLLAELPDHLRAMAIFTLNTGLRSRNVRYLEWHQVNLFQRQVIIPPAKSKTGKYITVPLNDEAMSILRQQLGQHPQYVFTYKDKPVLQCSTKAWRKALERAGISDFKWHDLRHTCASWLVMAGVPLNEVKDILGHKDFKSTLRYQHLSSQHLKEAVDKLDRSGAELVNLNLVK